MWRLSAVLGLALSVWCGAGAISISILSGPRTLSRAVQDHVCFSVDVVCDCVPTMHWSFMSGSVSRSIGMWRGNSTNITADYRGRVQPFANGSMALSKLRLQDAGFYVLTVTEEQGSSRDLGFVLKVTEVLYEDLQYLSVSALALACVAALLMFTVWLLEKLYRRIRAWKRQKRMPETDVTELQPL